MLLRSVTGGQPSMTSLSHLLQFFLFSVTDGGKMCLYPSKTCVSFRYKLNGTKCVFQAISVKNKEAVRKQMPKPHNLLKRLGSWVCTVSGSSSALKYIIVLIFGEYPNPVQDFLWKDEMFKSGCLFYKVFTLNQTVQGKRICSLHVIGRRGQLLHSTCTST